MATFLLTVAAGLIAALPQILTLIETMVNAKKGAADAIAEQDADIIDTYIPPKPPAR